MNFDFDNFIKHTKIIEKDWFDENEFIQNYLPPGSTVVKKRVDVDKRRGYEMSTTVFKINDRYLGVKHISDIFYRLDNVDELNNTLIFKEMIPKVITKYEELKKENND